MNELRQQHSAAMQQQRGRIEALEAGMASLTAGAEARQTLVDELQADKRQLEQDAQELRALLEQAQLALNRHQHDSNVMRLMEEDSTRLQAANTELQRSVEAFSRELDARTFESQALKVSWE